MDDIIRLVGNLLLNFSVGIYKYVSNLKEELAFVQDRLKILSSSLKMLELLDEPNPDLVDSTATIRTLGYEVQHCIDEFSFHPSKWMNEIKVKFTLIHHLKSIKNQLIKEDERVKRYRLSDTPGK
uniref:Rx N-terminal domain-containing protein n=1 Tax=Arundo donax TaxID=35708 RepID=A0A0A9GZA2_ARUDO